MPKGQTAEEKQEDFGEGILQQAGIHPRQPLAQVFRFPYELVAERIKECRKQNRRGPHKQRLGISGVDAADVDVQNTGEDNRRIEPDSPG